MKISKNITLTEYFDPISSEEERLFIKLIILKLDDLKSICSEFFNSFKEYDYHTLQEEQSILDSSWSRISFYLYDELVFEIVTFIGHGNIDWYIDLDSISCVKNEILNYLNNTND